MRSRSIPTIISLFTLLASLFGSAIFTTPVYASVGNNITVNSNLDTVAEDGLCTLREAITSANLGTASGVTAGECAAAASPVTITFAGNYTITLASSLPSPEINDLSIIGNGAANTLIQANAAPNTATYRIIRLWYTGTLTLDSLTLRNGVCPTTCGGYGGAVDLVNSSTLNVLNSTISSNSAASGGGAIFVGTNATLKVEDSTLTGNTVTDEYSEGGAIHAQGTVTVINSTLSSNSAAGQGGGLYQSIKTASITDSLFSGNHSGEGGGGGVHNRSAIVMVTNSSFTNNTATGTTHAHGGGIQNGGTGTLTVTGSSFSGNSALTASVSDGGGISSNYYQGIATVTNSSFSGNSSDYGGGLYNEGALTVTNSTLSGNSATSAGGGIEAYRATSTTTLNNTIVANSTSGGDCATNTTTITADSRNLDSDGTCGDATQQTITEIGLGSYQNNGGTTSTFAITSASSAYDAGDNATCATTDQRGLVRPQGIACDIGAFEVDQAPKVTSVTSSTADGAYKAAQVIAVTVNFTEIVNKTGTPQLTLETGTTDRTVDYTGGTGTSALTFNYTVQAGDTSSDLDYLYTTALSLNSGTIKDATDNAAVLTLPTPGDLGSLGANKVIVIDTTPPTVGIDVADTALLAGETSQVTITFSEAVSGFGNAELTVANGSLTTVSSADGGVTWTATLTPTANLIDATNVITVSNTGFRDTAGNTGTGTTDSNNYAINTVRPTAGIVVADTSLLAGETSLVTFTFSEAVIGFTNADLTIPNGSLSTVINEDGGGIAWIATLTPTNEIMDSTNVITLDNSAFTNVAGSAGTGTTDSNNYAIDTVLPTVGIVVADTSLLAGETSLVTFTFSEAVIGFSNGDLTVPNGSLSTVGSLDGDVTWTATLTPNADITNTTNTITLDNSGVSNATGNAGTGTTNSNNYAIDTVLPDLISFTLEAPAASLTNADTLVFLVTFGEAVSGVDTGDFMVNARSSATISDVSQLTGSTYTVTFSGGDLTSFNGTVGLDLVASPTINDLVGNPLPAGEPSTDETFTMDNRAPRIVSITRVDPNPTSFQSVSFLVTFSEDITGVDEADFNLVQSGAVTGSSVIFVSGSGKSWVVSISTGNGNGSIGLSIPILATISDNAENLLAGLPYIRGQKYWTNKKIVFRSTAHEDGWVLESAENSNTGGRMNSSSRTLFLGDNNRDRQFIAILSFDTAFLPNTAVITGVTLKLKLRDVVGTDPFDTLGNLLVDVNTGVFSGNQVLEIGDLQALASQDSVGGIPNSPVNGWYNRSWGKGIVDYINKDGLTQLRLHFVKGDNDNNNTDYFKFFSGDANTPAQPQLIIEYYIP